MILLTEAPSTLRIPAGLVPDLEPRAEIDPARVRGRLIDDPHAVEAFTQKPNAAIDFGQLALAIDVLGILGTVSLRSSFGHGARDFRPLGSPQVV
jgi:hypothetical protein